MKHVEKTSLRQTVAIEPFFTQLHVEIDINSKYLLSCSSQKTIKVLDIESGKVVKSIPENEADESIEDVVQFTISKIADRDDLVIAYSSGLLRHFKWSADPVKLVRTWKSVHIGPISRMAFDKTAGTLLATGGCDSAVKIWDTERLYCTHNLKGAIGVITVVTFELMPQKDRYYVMASGDQENKIVIWDLLTSKVVNKLEGHVSVVTVIKQLPSDHNKIISASRDNIIILWSLQNFAALKKLPVFESIEGLDLLTPAQRTFITQEYDPKATLVITSGQHGAVKVWDLDNSRLVFTQTNSILKRITDSNDSVITQSVLCPELNEVAIVSYENNVLFHSLDDMTLKRQLIGHVDEVLSVRFLGNQEKYLLVSTNSPIIKIFSVETSSCFTVEGHSDIVLTVQVFPSDPNMFASSSKDNTVRIWTFDPEHQTAKCLYRGAGHSYSVTSLAVPNKMTDLVVSGSEDTTIKLWRLPSETDADVMSLHTVDAAKAHDKDINSLDIAPNDKFVASGSQDKTAKIWSIDGGKRLTHLGTLRGHRRGIWCIKFSPVDQIVATSSADGTIKLWALADYSCLKTFQGHDCSVLSLAFATRGMQIISTASDGNLKLWSVKKTECLKTIDAHSDKTWALAVSKDESLVATGAADSRIVIWKDVTEEETEEAAQKQDELSTNQQTLANLIQRKNWIKAIKISIKMAQPFRSLSILKEILLNGSDLREVLSDLRRDQLIELLRYALDWNKNSKHCSAAQAVIKLAMTKIPVDDILALSDSKTILSTLIPFTERHFARADKLLQQATFLDFLWGSMKLKDLTITDDESKLDVPENEVMVAKTTIDHSRETEDVEGNALFDKEPVLVGSGDESEVDGIDDDDDDDEEPQVEEAELEPEEKMASGDEINQLEDENHRDDNSDSGLSDQDIPEILGADDGRSRGGRTDDRRGHRKTSSRLTDRGSGRGGFVSRGRGRGGSGRGMGRGRGSDRGRGRGSSRGRAMTRPARRGGRF
ncbi:Transducin beta-like protein 3 [Halotydeus destructor]|nr:Transducin beta-like protein 3 [Halotydeus destructor]